MPSLDEQIRSLRHELAVLDTSVERLTQQCEAEGRDLTDEELTSMSQDLARTETLEAEIKALEHRYQSQAVLQQARDVHDRLNQAPRPKTQLPPGPIGGQRWGMQPDRAALWLPGQGPRSYAELFGRPPASGWESAAEFLSVVYFNQSDRRLIPAAALGESSGPRGGYLLPMEYEQRLLDVPLHMGIVLPRATVVPMVAREKLVAGFNGQDQSNALSMYGFTYKWLVENQEEAAGTGEVRALTLRARPLGCYVGASNEIYADVEDFEDVLTGAMGTGLTEALDDAYLNGLGAGVPLGVLHSPALIAVDAVGGQIAGTLVYQNLLDILSHHASPQTAVWVCNPSTIPSLFSLTITVGDGGSHVPVVQVGQDNQMYMLGRPLLQSHRLPVLGTQGDVGLYDFAWYYVGLRQGSTLERSAHAGFMANQTVWRLIIRVDGMPRLSAPITGADGRTYSPFVTVATRS